MFEQDYVMRMIHEMVRAALKFLFDIDSVSPTEELLKDEAEKENFEKLLDMADKGLFDKAKTTLENFADRSDTDALKIGLLYYSRINEFDDDFLDKNDYSRDEIEKDIHTLLDKYNLGGLIPHTAE